MMYRILFVATVSLLCPSYLFSPVPTEEHGDDQIVDDVKELESLRTENIKDNKTGGSYHENMDLGEEVPEPLPTPLANTEFRGPTSLDEERQANSRSAIFRHRGITKAKKSNIWNEKTQPPSEGYAKFAGIQYSPSDLAAYVFKTGDEEGVAVAVEELVREGMMGRTDAINYLQDVKQILSYFRDQYEAQWKLQEFRNRAYPKPELTQRYPNPPREQFISEIDTEKRQPKIVDVPPAPVVTTEHPHQVVIASTSVPKGPTHAASTTMPPKTDASAAESYNEDKEEAYKDDDYKRRVPPKDSNTFTLEVIYKLAKDMFTQSLLRDDQTAEETLTGLVTFLESEVGDNRNSPAMKEKVLEIVSSALVDSLRDYQVYLPENQGPIFDESGLYQHLSDTSGSSVSKVPMSQVYRKIGHERHDNMLQLASKSNRPKSS